MIYWKFLADSISIKSLPNVTADNSAISRILTTVFIIIAAVSILFVTIGGFRYVISQGDPQAVAKAKSTIIFAVLGLVIAIVAQAVVAFVLVRLK